MSSGLIDLLQSNRTIEREKAHPSKSNSHICLFRDESKRNDIHSTHRMTRSAWISGVLGLNSEECSGCEMKSKKASHATSTEVPKLI